jgi:hypothetical protein
VRDGVEGRGRRLVVHGPLVLAIVSGQADAGPLLAIVASQLLTVVLRCRARRCLAPTRSMGGSSARLNRRASRSLTPRTSKPPSVQAVQLRHALSTHTLVRSAVRWIGGGHFGLLGCSPNLHDQQRQQATGNVGDHPVSAQ